MNITFMDGISITISSMTIVLLTLALIAVVLSSFKVLFKENKKEEVKPVTTNTVIDDNDEEERLVACLTASIMAGNGKLNPNLHIRSIKRVK
ncbi:OadG family protein [Romboutsia sp. Marseille-P6047]|uniref:OadG family protein n=1 Tax=Romboutsia sp. Marseille-P6047 TaxID=2161817 RepID=UPI000F04E2F1|nr:OadG family transporter subunit [Romboutsia sp. Marseille-P6047]